MKRKTRFVGIVLTIGLLCLPSVALADLVTSFEAGDLDGWNAGVLNSVATVVNTNRASDGDYSTESSFTVPASFSGWTMNTLLSKDTAALGITSSTTQVSLDAYGDWSNPIGWGVYANNIHLILNYDGGWQNVSPTTGSLTDGTFTTLTYDISPYAAAMSAPGLAYSEMQIAWHVGTWAGGGDGLDNGTQTISLDNINIEHLGVIPEPASLALLASCVFGWCATRPRRIE